MRYSHRLIYVYAAAALAVGAQTTPGIERRATFTTAGSGGWDKCTIEVVVDGIADVEIRRETAILRTLAGQPAQWRRFECSGPLTLYPEEFRFKGIDGRGNQRLVQDPRQGRGTAIVRIEDPRGGSEGYTFDIEWRGGGNTPGPGRAGDFPRDPTPPGRTPDRGVSRDLGRLVSQCQRAIEERAARDGYSNLIVESLQADLRPGQNNWIAGTATAQASRVARPAALNFSCTVNADTGVIYSAELTRR